MVTETAATTTTTTATGKGGPLDALEFAGGLLAAHGVLRALTSRDSKNAGGFVAQAIVGVAMAATAHFYNNRR